MHRTDGANHVSNEFVDGDPGVPTPGTQIEQHWLNAVQEELCNVVELAGLTLVKDDNDQLYEALTVLYVPRAGDDYIEGEKTFEDLHTDGPLVLEAAAPANGTAFAVPALTAGNVCRVKARVELAGTTPSIASGQAFNVAGVALTGTGKYELTLAGGDSTDMILFASVAAGGQGLKAEVYPAVPTTDKITVQFTDNNGTVASASGAVRFMVIGF